MARRRLLSWAFALGVLALVVGSVAPGNPLPRRGVPVSSAPAGPARNAVLPLAPAGTALVAVSRSNRSVFRTAIAPGIAAGLLVVVAALRRRHHHLARIGAALVGPNRRRGPPRLCF